MFIERGQKVIRIEYKAFSKENSFLDSPYLCNSNLYCEIIKDVFFYRPNTTYERLGKLLLTRVLIPSYNDKYLHNVNGASIGFEYQRNYSGRMADEKNRNRPKRGLFDFKISTNGFLDTTHFRVFEEILEYSNLSNCISIWEGKSPSVVTSNKNERIILYKLLLMMFEQEVNWGDESFQEFTAFPPSYQCAPRGMLMGFIDMMFNNGDFPRLSNIPDWKKNKKTEKSMTPMFGPENKYKGYEGKLKQTHFSPYREKGDAMMQGKLRSLFLRTSHLFLPND